MIFRRLLFLVLLASSIVIQFVPCGLGLAGEIEKITVVSPAWEGYTQEDGSGLYFELLREIYRPRGIAVKTLIVPWKRGKKMVLNGQADCMPAAYLTPNDYRWTYPAYPIDVDHIAVVFLRGRIDSRAVFGTLAGKSVVWPRGYNFQNYMDIQVNWTEIDSNQQGWEMVEKKRVDFYMDILPEIKSFVKEKHIDLKRFGYETVFTIKTYVRFGNSSKAETLRHIYDERIAQLLEEKELHRLFKKWGADFPEPSFTKR